MKKTLLHKFDEHYQLLSRERFKLLTSGYLSQEEFVFWEMSFAVADWDPRHDNYGTFKITDQNFAKALNLRSRSSTNKYKNNLIKKGFFSLVDDGRIKITDFEEIISGKIGIPKTIKNSLFVHNFEHSVEKNEHIVQKSEQDEPKRVSFKEDVSENLVTKDTEEDVFDPRLSLGEGTQKFTEELPVIIKGNIDDFDLFNLLEEINEQESSGQMA